MKKFYKGELLTFRVSKNSAAKLGCAKVAPRPGKYFLQVALANFDCRGWSAHPVLQFGPPKKGGCPKNEARKSGGKNEQLKTVKKFYKGELATFWVSKTSARKIGCGNAPKRENRIFTRKKLVNNSSFEKLIAGIVRNEKIRYFQKTVKQIDGPKIRARE